MSNGIKFSIVLLFLLISAVSRSNNVVVNTRITDQYGGTVKKLKIERFDGTHYIPLSYTDKKLGNITFTANSTDSIIFSAFKNSTIRTTVQDIATQNKVEIKRPFSMIDLVNPQFYIFYGGLWLLLFIVFAETGLFLGFFLPGDSLLFIAGVYSQNLAKSFFDTGSNFGNLVTVMLLIIIAGILGNILGYYMGDRSKKFFYSMKDSWYFKRRYLDEAHDFYVKYGGGAIFLARFLPMVRTFAPIVAGIVKMDKKKFMFYNIVGCIAWVVLLVAGGHYLDAYIRNTFHFELKDHLGLIIISLIVITTSPVLWKLFTAKSAKRKSTNSENNETY